MVGVECNLIEGESIVYQRNVLQDQINYFVIHLFKKIWPISSSKLLSAPRSVLLPNIGILLFILQLKHIINSKRPND